MVTLVVATTTDPASYGPATALLAMPGWQSGPTFQVPSPLYTHTCVNVCIFVNAYIFVIYLCDDDWYFCWIVRV